MTNPDRQNARICRTYSRLSSVKTTDEFRHIYRKGTCFREYPFMLYVLQNGLPESRLGISVSKKNGNSVVRHRIIRLIRESARLKAPDIKKGFDLVMTLRRDVSYDRAAQLSFDELDKTVSRLLRKAHIII